MTGYIYLIRNLINGKGYVGQTRVSTEMRFAAHKRAARSKLNTLLCRAIRKYGIEAFAVVEVASCEVGPLLNDLETHYIKHFATYAPSGQHGYNMTEGGESAPFLKGTLKHPPRSASWKLKQTAAKTGKPVSKETRLKISAALKGKAKPPRSADHIANIKTSKIGQNKGIPWSAARRAAHERSA